MAFDPADIIDLSAVPVLPPGYTLPADSTVLFTEPVSTAGVVPPSYRLTLSQATALFVPAQQTVAAPTFTNFVDDAAGGSVQLVVTTGVPLSDYRYQVGASGPPLSVPPSGIIAVGNVAGIVYAYSVATASRAQSPTAATAAFTASLAVPTVNFVAPLNNTTVPANTSILLRATASDVSGITQVVFANNGTLIGTTSTLASGAYQVPYTTPASGTMSLTARATAGSGQTALDSTYVFVSVPAAAPTLTSFTPSTGAVGALINVTGTNLGGLSAATLNGQPVNFTAISSTQYSFIIPAGASSGVLSATASAGTAVSTTTMTVARVPDAPTGVSGTAGVGYVDLAFSAPLNNGGSPIQLFNVYRNGDLTPTFSSTRVVFRDTNVVAGTAYTYQVTAVNNVGEGPKSAASVAATPTAPAVITPVVTAPSAPGTPSATGGVGQITIAYAAPTSTGGAAISGYNIYRNGGSIPIASTAGLSYVDGTAINGTIYTYQVTAVNSAGESAKSLSSPQASASAPPATNYNTILTAGQSDPTGVTFTSNGGDSFRFNSITGGNSAAKRMNIYISGTVVGVVDFPASYVGAAFLYTPANGSARSGSFTDGNVTI